MNIAKVKDAITELDAEAEHCKRLADELRVVVQRYSNGNGNVIPLVEKPRGQRRLNLRHRDEQKSVRTLALELLEKQEKPLHVDQLVELINAERNDPTNRSAVESQLVRALKQPKFGVRRTAPGTFTVSR